MLPPKTRTCKRTREGEASAEPHKVGRRPHTMGCRRLRAVAEAMARRRHTSRPVVAWRLVCGCCSGRVIPGSQRTTHNPPEAECGRPPKIGFCVGGIRGCWTREWGGADFSPHGMTHALAISERHKNARLQAGDDSFSSTNWAYSHSYTSSRPSSKYGRSTSGNVTSVQGDVSIGRTSHVSPGIHSTHRTAAPNGSSEAQISYTSTSKPVVGRMPR